MTKAVFATFQQAGMHHWPDAPDEHAYLRAPHRHVFHVRVEVAVGGLNRDVEFILLKHNAQGAFLLLAYAGDAQLYEGVPNYGARSCEMLAQELKNVLEEGTQYRITAIEISEDGENGARLAWNES